MDAKEVEIRAQGENSQLFQDSIMQSHMSQQQRGGRGQVQGYGGLGL